MVTSQKMIIELPNAPFGRRLGLLRRLLSERVDNSMIIFFKVITGLPNALRS